MTTPRAPTLPAYTPGQPRSARSQGPVAGQSYGWVYVWHPAIRAMHWIAAVALIVLLVTAVLLARPGFSAGTASWSFALQWVRLVHFGAAGVLVATAIVRLYWLFVGNRYERWSALVPLHAREWKNLGRMARYYLFIGHEKPPRYLGHNPLAQIIYTLTYAVGLVMILTGFIMYGEANPGGLINGLFTWMAPYFGGVQWVRAIHHALSWFFPPFIILHVYLAIRTDLLQVGGLISSMITGDVFVRVGERHVDE